MRRQDRWQRRLDGRSNEGEKIEWMTERERWKERRKGVEKGS